VRGGGEVFGHICLYKANVSGTKVDSITYVTMFCIGREAAQVVLKVWRCRSTLSNPHRKLLDLSA
jgi:hypothetical protein